MPSEKTQVAIDHPSTTFAASPAIVSGALDDAGDIQSPIAPGGVTDDRQPGFHGQGTPGDTIVIRDNGNEIGTTEVADDGTWTFTPSTDLLQGLHAITVAALDTNGNEGAPSPAFNFEIDVTPPDASRLNVSGFTDNVGGVTGNVISGGTTDETRPLLSGISNGTPGHTVTVMVKDATGTHELGLATIGENGQWTFQVDTPLAAGLNTFMLVERDAAGNETMPTGRYKVTVNTDKPNAPVIDSVFDDVGEPHMLQQGEATNDARPTLAGTAQANHTVKFYDGSTYLGKAVADDDGKWRFTPQIDLPDGTYNITATSTSPVGQTSDASSAWNFVVDTTAPTQTATLTDIGKDSGFDVDDYLTNDGSAGRLMMGQLSAPLAAGDTLQVSTDGGKTWKAAFVDGTQWSAQDDNSHADSWTVQTRVVDEAGNAGAVQSQAITLDVIAPAAPASVLVNGSELTVVFNKIGTSAGDRINIASGNNRLEYTLTTEDVLAGSVKITPPFDLYAANTVVRTIDRAGNASEGVSGAASLSTGFENITGVSLNDLYAIKPGVSAFSDGFHITMKKGSGAFLDKKTGGGALGNSLHVWASSIMEIKLTAISKSVKLNWIGSEHNNAHLLNIYDENGILIDVVGLKTRDGEINYVAPEGKGVSKIEFAIGALEAGTISIENLSIIPVDKIHNPFNDIVKSHGSYIGGDADDIFSLASISDLDFPQMSVKGEGGLDTLRFTGNSQALDLTALTSKLSSIEVIDLTGSGNNTLKLSLADVMENGAKDQFVADGRVQMMVKGNAGDKVTLSDVLPNGTDPGDWVKKANVTVGGVVYEVYQHSGFDAELLVQQGVTVTLQNAGAGTFHIEPELEAYVLDHATMTWTDSDDTLIARLGFADRLEGGAGNDTFTKVGTGDTVHGGAGDDTIRINSGDFARLDGGLGIDTLVMDGKSMHIDLSALGAKVQGFEKFDLGAGGNTLALSAHDVLAGGARDMVMADGKVQMLVNGANGDVNLLGGDDSWTQGGNATVSGVTYSVYTNLAGTAELLVEDKVHVTIL